METFGLLLEYKCTLLSRTAGQLAAPDFDFGSAGSCVRQPRAVLCAITPDRGAPWVGRFGPGPPDYPLTGVFATPFPKHACIVASGQGYIVPVLAPMEWEKVMAAPVLAVARVPERAILLFADFQDLCAYGPNGIVWWIKRLALDA